MKKRRLILAAFFAVLAACSTATATTKSATPRPSATARAAATSAAATMSMTPSEMAAMGSASPSAIAAATQSAASASSPAAATQASATQATATTAPAATAAATQAPTSAPATAAPNTPAPTTAPSGPATTVTVTLVDTGIRLSTTSVSAGTVTFNVTNAGTTPHEFVVLQTNIAQNALPPDPSNPAIAQEPGFLGKVANLQPKQAGTLTLALPAASYVLICNEPAHYSALGMHIGFTAR